ncbi:SCO family protein [Halomonas beimenensis]|uniref:Cytochrome oxidase biogenesis protein Sco1/SenC/PrrC n=1 Tax=Halomonas beimenensis TaxID=475662 RepID=A0A291P2I6_9GAMM|nr:SCO family protein [Halomonas beimenensis]ATJ81092.1 cytochrome oxidase biogenesis protein Sco1/SenC/PrrC [Halomonas beimenensis]
MTRQGRIGLALGAALLAATAVWLGYQHWTGGRDGLPEGGPIELPSTQGEFSLRQLDEDQLAVVFFGYTWCPDVCPMSLAVVRQARGALPEAQRERVVPLMVSVDPERDTLARLEEYLAYFGEAFIGATGSQAQLEDIAERYGVVWRKVETPDSALDYTVDHTASLYLVDAAGEIRRRVLHSPTPGPLQAALEAEIGGRQGG